MLVDQKQAIDLSLTQSRNAIQGVDRLSVIISLARRHALHHDSFRAKRADAPTHSTRLV
jgi:hypothetical protein